MPRGAEQIVEGYGSGFVVSSDGVVITNQHVSQGAEQIVITTRDGRDFPAKLLGEDPLTDIAVLKVSGSDLPVAPLGKSTDLQIGEWVVAVGNPFAYLLGNTEPTVTAGVVSAVGRNLLRTLLDWEAVLLDTGPGDTLTVSHRHGMQTRTARLPVTDLPTTLAEKVSVLGGIKVVTVTDAIRAERNIQSDHGALIYDIPEEMQQATGLQSGDVVLQINRVRIGRAADLPRAFSAAVGGGAGTGGLERAGRLGKTAFYVR